MNTKTLTAIMVIILCVLLFPVFIGIIGGLFGIIGGVFGAIFGLLGGLFGAFFGLLGGIVGVIGWLFKSALSWHGPFGFFTWNLIPIALVLLIIVLITRSKTSRSGK